MGQDGPAAAHARSESLASYLQLIRPGMCILFVDPDLAGAERSADALRGHHTVAVVGSAQAALVQLERRVPDLIIIETNLPDANGLELVARWRAAPLTRHTLLMVVTARRSTREKIAGLQAGADDYLIKPVGQVQLLAHIAAISRFRRMIHGPLYN
jgi:DNA-binding response OmpR family regulator